MTLFERKSDYLNKYKLTMLVFAVAVIVYLPSIVMDLPNPDAIWNGMLYKDSFIWEVALCRFMIPTLQNMTGHGVYGSLFSVIGLGLIAVTGYIIVELLEIKDTISKLVVQLLFILSPFVQCGLTYYYCFIYYSIACLLAVSALYMADRNCDLRQRRILKIFISMALLMLSLAIYQSFLALVIPLGIIRLFLCLSDGNEYKGVIRKIIDYMAVMFGGIFIYLISNKIALKLYGTDATSGRGFSSMGKLQLTDIGKEFITCFKYFMEYFWGNLFINNEYGFILTRFQINVIVLVVLFAMDIAFILKKKDWIRLLFAHLVLIILPISIFIFVIIAPGTSILEATGVMMIPGVNCLYILLVCLAGRMDYKFLQKIGIALSCLVIIMLAQLGGDGRNYLKYCMNKTNYLAYEISHRISEEAENGENKICIVGKAEDGNYPNKYENLKDSVKWTTFSYGVIWPDPAGAQACWTKFMNDFLGTNYKKCSMEEYSGIIESSKYKEMSVFPSEGSVEVINDIIVVKLSNVDF